MVPRGRARRSDPATSQAAVRAITADVTYYEQVLRAAALSWDRRAKGFTDDWLARTTRIPRHVVARVRLECERDGWIERGAPVRRDDGIEVLTFRLRPGRREVIAMVAQVTDDNWENR